MHRLKPPTFYRTNTRVSPCLQHLIVQVQVLEVQAHLLPQFLIGKGQGRTTKLSIGRGQGRTTMLSARTFKECMMIRLVIITKIILWKSIFYLVFGLFHSLPRKSLYSWGFKYHTSLVFKCLKLVLLPNDLAFRCHVKTGLVFKC